MSSIENKIIINQHNEELSKEALDTIIVSDCDCDYVLIKDTIFDPNDFFRTFNDSELQESSKVPDLKYHNILGFSKIPDIDIDIDIFKLNKEANLGIDFNRPLEENMDWLETYLDSCLKPDQNYEHLDIQTEEPLVNII